MRRSRPAVVKQNAPILAKDIRIVSPKKSLVAGEKLTYNISWLRVPVGQIVSHIKKITEINGREAYLIELTVKTNTFCSAIYKIDDKFVTYLDTETILPLRHELRRAEGRHRKRYIVEYDHKNNKATYHNLIENWTRVSDIPDGAQDPLSAIYWFRTKDVKLGMPIDFYVNLNEKNYNVLGTIEEKTIVEVPNIGVFDAFWSRPVAKLNGKVEKKGKAQGYFSADESRIPLLGVVDVWVRLIGRVAVTLGKIEYIVE